MNRQRESQSLRITSGVVSYITSGIYSSITSRIAPNITPRVRSCRVRLFRQLHGVFGLRYVILGLILAFLIVSSGGCGTKSKTKVGTAGAAATSLTIRGSNTMLPLATALAEAYEKTHEGVQISVTDGGSTVGIEALMDGTADLCMSSREVSAEEKEKSEFHRAPLEGVVVSLDGVSIIVNSRNPVSELTIAQLREIFGGRISNWREVGGPDQAIQVVSRGQGSGTESFFRERVLRGEDYKSKIQTAGSNALVAQSVEREIWSIGYVGFAFTQAAGLKVVGIKKDAAGAPEFPSPATIGDGSYPLARPLYIYASGKSGDLAMDFLEYVLSQEGQRVVREKGYVPV